MIVSWNDVSISPSPIQVKKINVQMTLEGWWEKRNLFPRCAGVYILQGIQDNNTVVLRIGIAGGKKGIYGRWFSSQSAHYYAWRGEQLRTVRYAHFYNRCAVEFPCAQLVFLLYPKFALSDLRPIERELIWALSPIWERRKKKGFATAAGSQNGVVPLLFPDSGVRS